MSRMDRNIRLEYDSELYNLAKPYESLKNEVIAGSRFEGTPINYARIDMTNVESLEFLDQTQLKEAGLTDNEIGQVRSGLNYTNRKDYRHYLSTLAKDRSFAITRFFNFEEVEYAMISVHRHRLVLPVSILKLKRERSESEAVTKNEIALAANKEEHALMTLDYQSAVEEMNRIEDFESGELVTMMQEYEKMKAEVELQAKKMYEMQLKMKAELSAKMEILKHQLFVLDTEIYAMDCRFGLSVDFVQLRAGKNADVDLPIVINQKTQFLDEDLVRIKTMYNLESNDLQTILKGSDLAFNHFMNSDKCITFIKKSKNDESLEQVGNTRYRVMKRSMPSEVGILVRNGDNLWMTWCDADRIQIKEDSFNSNSTHEELTKELFSSRYFIFNIILGILDTQQMLQTRERIEDIRQLQSSSSIIFSNADSAIVDTRFITMSDYHYATSRACKYGDNIYVFNRMTDGEWVGSRFGYASTERSKGDSTLTYGAEMKSGLNRISAVEYLISSRNYYTKADHAYSESIKPNFRVFSDEMFNFEYVTSDLIRYWLMTKRTGEFYQNGANAKFAHLSNQLLKMLEIIETREKEESEIINLVTDRKFTVGLIASFKLIKNVRNLTEFQVKRLIKWVDSLSTEEFSYYSEYLVVNEISKYLGETKYLIKIYDSELDLDDTSFNEKEKEYRRNKYLSEDEHVDFGDYMTLRVFSSEKNARKKAEEILDKAIASQSRSWGRYEKFRTIRENYSIVEIFYDDMNNSSIVKEIKL